LLKNKENCALKLVDETMNKQFLSKLFTLVQHLMIFLNICW